MSFGCGTLIVGRCVQLLASCIDIGPLSASFMLFALELGSSLEEDSLHPYMLVGCSF